MKDNKTVSVRRTIIAFLVILNVVFIKAGFTRDANWYWFILVTLPLLILALTIKYNKTLLTQKNNNY